MKILPIVILFILSSIVPEAIAQYTWSPPAKLTSGPSNDTHPTLANSTWFSQDTVEWLAFTRSRATGSDICCIKTSGSNPDWDSQIVSLTIDSMNNDYVSMARTGQAARPPHQYMAVWERSGGLGYSYNPDGAWLPAGILTADSIPDLRPCVAVYGTGFGVVWEKGGRIMISEFTPGGGWSAPQPVPFAASDSGNSHPAMRYTPGDFGTSYPAVVWEKTHPGDSLRMILCSVRTDSGWRAPDTLASRGHHSAPKFFQVTMFGGIEVFWDSTRPDGSATIAGAQGFYDLRDGLVWYQRDEEMFPYQTQNIGHGSFMNYPVITAGRNTPNSTALYYASGVWMVQTDSGYTLGSRPLRYDNPVNSMTVRNPVISSGAGTVNGIRLRSVWEDTAAGAWKLYGSWVVVLLGVSNGPDVSHAFSLRQNYPNPFNPETNLYFVLGTSSFVNLQIFDILGREVAAPISSRMEAGEHTIRWNASGLPSGVYYCRMTAGGYSGVMKMMLLR